MERPLRAGRRRLTDIGHRRSAGGRSRPTVHMNSRRRWVPYALLARARRGSCSSSPIPMGYMLIVSLQEGTLRTGFELTWNFGIYPEVIAGTGRCSSDPSSTPC